MHYWWVRAYRYPRLLLSYQSMDICVYRYVFAIFWPEHTRFCRTMNNIVRSALIEPVSNTPRLFVL